MHLDWYDRKILTFMLEWAPQSEPPREQSYAHFGIDARRVMRRFNAVIEAFSSNEMPLAEADLHLLRRAAQFRAGAGS